MKLGKFFASVLILALMLSALPVQFSASAAAPAELFFSEYIEGSSNNKALEIYNGTGAAVDLTAGTVHMTGTTASGVNVTLNGVIRSWWTVKGVRKGPKVIHSTLSFN